MDNHYHFLIETHRGNLSSVLHHINASYTGYFNRKYHRVGHLFQGRYKAILVEKDAYALELSRYIHLNPVRAEMVGKPEDYAWSSYHSYVGTEREPSFLKTDTILSYFGKKRGMAKKMYQQFTEEGLQTEVKNPLGKVVASTILGGEKYISWVQKEFITGQGAKRDIPALRVLAPQVSVDTIQQKVIRLIRDRKLSRKISLYMIHRYSGLRLKEIGQLFGGLGESGVSQNTRRLEEELRRDKKLKALVEELKTNVL
jgi:hypothetical protein